VNKLTLTLTLGRAVFVLACVLLAWTSFSAWSIYSYAGYSDEVKADGIIVLGAAVWKDQPSPVFQERINHAIQLHKDGYAPIIIFTGGKGAGEELAESEVAKQYAIKC
jgi:vancomycin permeability regulator SanA